MFLTHVMWVFDRSARLLYLPVCVYILSVFYLCILPYIDCCWKASTSSEERLIKLGHVSFCVCYSMCLTVVQFVKRQFDTFAWSCASINPTPLKQEYGGGIRGRVIQFIKKKKKKRSVGVIDFTLVLLFVTMPPLCTIMNFKALMFPYVIHLPVGMFSSHTQMSF